MSDLTFYSYCLLRFWYYSKLEFSFVRDNGEGEIDLLYMWEVMPSLSKPFCSINSYSVDLRVGLC
jgi:hypothetical protein